MTCRNCDGGYDWVDYTSGYNWRIRPDQRSLFLGAVPEWAIRMILWLAISPRLRGEAR